MSYVINYSGGTITIPLNTANTSGTSLTLVGRNWTSANTQQGYGQALNQNFVSLLENFANSTVPTSPLKGQFWYDTSTSEIKVNNGTPGSPNWATMYSTSSSITGINNGTSGVDIPVLNGNVNISSGGTSNVLVVTSTGANVFGTLTSNGQVTGSTIRSTVNDGSTPPLTVASAIRVTNLNADLLDGYHANTTPNSLNTVVVRSAFTGKIENDIAGNIDGNFGNLSTVNATNVNATNIAGVLTTASQPNITSVGTLTSLTSSGTITAPTFTGDLTGNATTAGTVTTAAQPNITSVGTLAGLTATGVINLAGSSNVALGPVGNVQITGGTSGQFLQTNGSGALVWATVGTSGISNGTSNISIPVASGNVNLSAGGNANVFVVTTTGANVAGTFTVTGNVTGANLVTAGVANVDSLRTSNITTGANTTAGSMTGNWTLTTGSRLQSTYADLAEYYVIDRAAGVATVVEFGGSQEIRICNTVMSRAVAGVVSTNPAFIMNTEGAVPGQIREAVALQGRVPCKVIGLASKGDLMVSAGNGAAMRCDDPVMGSVIGKSLEDKTTADLAIIEIAVGRL